MEKAVCSWNISSIPLKHHAINPSEIPPATRDLPIKCCTHTKEEIDGAIQQLKNGTSKGPASTSAEALKADIDTSV
ncbi:hypothetical protein DPMN_077629 [Dreissena polymorpha]|uniref:Uncharacterized protein n=1 Tax=Dreissena polymorpha TaxID=45954 RepID=A0A9D3YPN6_DREPO|nr:hypothetical protein DPMN_077629 [Dreissena polymorpha]